MSCYIVNNETISIIAKGLVDYGVDTPFCKFDTMETIIVNARYPKIGQALLEQNYKSYNYRYNDVEEVPQFEFSEIESNDAILLGCIRCYEYQACETPNYFNSDIHEALATVKLKMLDKLVKRACNCDRLPWGYEGYEV